MRDHRKLEAFQLADALVLRIYEATRHFPSEERFALVVQMRRAAVSIGANIAEGSSRPSQTEYIRFLIIALGSARELEYELSIAARLGYLQTEQPEHLELLATRTCRALYGLIQAFRMSDPRP